MNRTAVVITLIIVGGVGFVVLTHLNPDAPATASVLVTLLFTQVISVLAFFAKVDRSKADQEAKISSMAKDVGTIKTNTNGRLTELKANLEAAEHRAKTSELENVYLRTKYGVKDES